VSVLLLGTLLYVWALISAQQNLLELRSIDILSLPTALFPLFYVALMFMVISTIWATVRNDQRVACVSVLSFGVMIWLTPYLLSFLPRYPDALFYTRGALSLNEILSAKTDSFTLYVKSYPASFAFDYVVLNVTGMDALTYARLVYPAIAVVTTLVLCFAFCSRLIGRQISSLAIMLALPGLQYVEFHLSPHSAGVVLVLAVLLLSCFRSRGAKVLIAISIITLILAHPIGPLIVALYWAGVALAARTRERLSQITYTGVAMVVMGWLGWLFLHSVVIGRAVSLEAYQLVTLGFAILKQTSIEAAGGGSNIYPEIPVIHTATVYMYVIVGILTLTPMLRREWIGSFRALTRGIARLRERGDVQLAVVASLFAVFAIMLGLTDTGLRERSLFYFVLFASILIIFRLFGAKAPRIRSMTMLFLALSICILTVMYPFVSYYGENYLSPSYSEGSGMSFLARSINLNGETVSTEFAQQLAYYSRNVSYADYGFPPQLKKEGFNAPEIVMFRESAFFYFATRIDLSLVPKTYLDSYNSISSLASYNKVYESSTIHLFVAVTSNASLTNP
jgi:hypothetical protein